VIFVTVGTQLPFPRLVEAVLEWHRTRPSTTLLVQHLQGPRAMPDAAPSVRLVHALTAEETRAAIREASLVVSHFGMGTLLNCLEVGRPLIALPRRVELGETRNDHQVEGAARFATRPGLAVARCESEVGGLIARFDGMRLEERISNSASPRLLEAVRDFVWEGRTSPQSKS
jgi:UDP-N-acetylglucosamine transferase subunit ALG13